MSTVRNVAVMFTDMKGFTARTARSSHKELLHLLCEHDRLIVPILESAGGTLIKTIGDALMMRFDDPKTAVIAAIEVQKNLVHHNENLRDERDCIELRIGIHCGEVTEIEGDLFGDVVNTAARIESISEPGTVYFSDAVLERLGPAIESGQVCPVDLGRRRLKGLPEAVQIYRHGGALKASSLLSGFWPLRWSGYALRFGFFGLSLLGCILAAYLGQWFASGVALVLALGIGFGRGRLPYAIMVLVICALVLLRGHTLEIFQNRLNSISEISKLGPGLSFRDRVFTMSLACSSGLWGKFRRPGGHEDMLFGACLGRGEERRFRAPPWSESRSVVALIRTLGRQKKARSGHLTRGQSLAAYALGRRWMLPASDIEFRVKAKKGGPQALAVFAHTRVVFGQRDSTELFGGKLLVDDELLAQLQKEGLLVPYEIRWSWMREKKRGPQGRVGALK